MLETKIQSSWSNRTSNLLKSQNLPTKSRGEFLLFRNYILHLHLLNINQKYVHFHQFTSR